MENAAQAGKVFVRLFPAGRISGATLVETINDPNQFH
jgi:hypothetical protein